MRDALAGFAAALPDALIALDFDGPLAPIVDDPRQSRPVPGTVETLTRLASDGVQIAIVTGRAAETVLELSGFAGVPGVIVSGVHGAEIWHDGQLTTRDEPAGLADLRAQLPPVLAAVDPAVWLEDKRLSLVVHTRQAADPDAALAALAGPVGRLTRAVGLDMHPGKMVLEIRIPHLSKADAVNVLLEAKPAGALFAGDDLGDVPAFTAVHDWTRRTGQPGVAVAVGAIDEVRRAADVRLESAQDLVATLGRFADLLD